MKLQKAVFEFEMSDNRTYSAHWYPNGSDNFSPDKINDKRKYEVSIFRGGGYKLSYYTDHRICEKNSREFVADYLKSLSPADMPYNSKP